MKAKVPSEEKTDRLLSLDALRGFDMFFITGGAGIVAGLCAVLGDEKCWIACQMFHVPWAGLAHHDTIFPLFLFLAGVSWPFSLVSQMTRNRTSWQIHRKVILRMAVLCFLGLCGGIFAFDPKFRIPSVLGHIGLSWGFAALVFMHVRKPIWRVGMIVALLVGYWLFLAFTGAPDAPLGADLYSKEWNVVSWLDRTLMPNHIYVRGDYDPESPFSVPAGVALALLGMTAGVILRRADWSPSRRCAVLCALSLATLAAGLFFIFILRMPVVKSLWTSSFVLIAAAYSFAMMALFYWIVDVRGWKRWTFYFRVIGMNSITIYMLMRLNVVPALHDYVFGGTMARFVEPAAGLVGSLTYQATCWLVLFFFYRKGLFLKV